MRPEKVNAKADYASMLEEGIAGFKKALRISFPFIFKCSPEATAGCKLAEQESYQLKYS
jgi:hypothetical protein